MHVQLCWKVIFTQGLCNDSFLRRKFWEVEPAFGAIFATCFCVVMYLDLLYNIAHCIFKGARNEFVNEFAKNAALVNVKRGIGADVFENFFDAREVCVQFRQIKPQYSMSMASAS